MKRDVTSRQVEEAMRDRSHVGVIQKVTSAFPMLDHEERVRCGLHGMWKALRSHDYSSRRSFTTSLGEWVKWECQHLMRPKLAVLRRCKQEEIDPDHIPREASTPEATAVRDMMDGLDDWQKDVIRKYYLEGLTYKEIAAKNGYSPETARQRVRSAMKTLREIANG